MDYIWYMIGHPGAMKAFFSKLAHNKTILFFLKGGSVIGCFYLISSRVFLNKDTNILWDRLFVDLSFHSPLFYCFFGVMGLALVNWSIEALKWIRLTPFYPVSLPKALAVVWSGTAIGFLTPNRVGEFGGRILNLPKEYRWKGVHANLVSSYTQLIVTLMLGSLSLVLMGAFYPSLLIERIPLFSIGILAFTLLLTGLFFLYCSGWVRDKLLETSFMRRNREKWEALFEFSGDRVGLTVLLSTLRYLVFVSQFYLLVRGLGLSLTAMEVYLLIGMVYLITTVVPSTFLGDLGVREAVSVLVFGAAGCNPGTVVSASLILWGVNLALPALFGSFFLAGKRIDHAPS